MKSTPIFLVFFGNRWGRGAFDEGHHEQVSLDGAFGEHVIITTGGGGVDIPNHLLRKLKREKLKTTPLGKNKKKDKNDKKN